MKKLRYLFEATLVYALMGLFRALPVEKASAFGGAIGRRIAYPLSATRKAKRHIEASLKTTPQETDKIARDMWDNLGRLFAEYPHLPEIYTNRAELVGVIDPSQTIYQQLTSQGMTHDQALAILERMLTEQSVMLATNELMLIVALMLIASAFFIWLVPKPARAVDPSAMH